MLYKILLKTAEKHFRKLGVTQEPSATFTLGSDGGVSLFPFSQMVLVNSWPANIKVFCCNKISETKGNDYKIYIFSLWLMKIWNRCICCKDMRKCIFALSHNITVSPNCCDIWFKRLWLDHQLGCNTLHFKLHEHVANKEGIQNSFQHREESLWGKQKVCWLHEDRKRLQMWVCHVWNTVLDV